MHEPERIRVDLHCHTRFSADGWTSPRELVERARGAGLARIAVTDHGEIEGALEAQRIDPARVIVGEEIRCEGGTELLGLFLSERVPMGLPIEAVARRVREQGGLVYAPHPFAYPRRASWHARRAMAVADIVEAFNARAFLPRWNAAAKAAAERAGLPGAAGSDAHFPWEIGRAYTEVAPFHGAADCLAAFGGGVAVGAGLGSPLDHLASMALRASRLGRRAW